jgi:hypothetical protein
VTNPRELWIKHSSVAPWCSPSMWDDYLRGIEGILDDRLVRLDDHDPVRRKADTTGSEGAFVVDFGRLEESRWVWGKFEKTKIRLQIWFHKSFRDSYGRTNGNMLTLMVPERLTSGPDVQRLKELFRLGNEKLQPYYSNADFMEVVCSVRPSISAHSVQNDRELSGIFWLTYLNSQYCEFFGRDRLLGLDSALPGPGNGIVLTLADSPAEVSQDHGVRLQASLGANAFASRGESGPPKETGEYVLTYEQLHEFGDQGGQVLG